VQNSGIESKTFVVFLQHKLLSAFSLPAFLSRIKRGQRQWKKIQLCVLCDSSEAPVKTGTSPAMRDRQGGDIKEYFQQKNKNEIKEWTLQIFQTSNRPGSV
jgi:hypothetical protein